MARTQILWNINGHNDAPLTPSDPAQSAGPAEGGAKRSADLPAPDSIARTAGVIALPSKQRPQRLFDEDEHCAPQPAVSSAPIGESQAAADAALLPSAGASSLVQPHMPHVSTQSETTAAPAPQTEVSTAPAPQPETTAAPAPQTEATAAPAPRPEATAAPAPQPETPAAPASQTETPVVVAEPESTVSLPLVTNASERKARREVGVFVQPAPVRRAPPRPPPAPTRPRTLIHDDPFAFRRTPPRSEPQLSKQPEPSQRKPTEPEKPRATPIKPSFARWTLPGLVVLLALVASIAMVSLAIQRTPVARSSARASSPNTTPQREGPAPSDHHIVSLPSPSPVARAAMPAPPLRAPRPTVSPAQARLQSIASRCVDQQIQRVPALHATARFEYHLVVGGGVVNALPHASVTEGDPAAATEIERCMADALAASPISTPRVREVTVRR